MANDLGDKLDTVNTEMCTFRRYNNDMHICAYEEGACDSKGSSIKLKGVQGAVLGRDMAPICMYFTKHQKKVQKQDDSEKSYKTDPYDNGVGWKNPLDGGK
jgi:hypothetical protein